MQVSMGKIYDRSREHLGTSDLGIITVRRRLLRDVRALEESGTVPDSALHPDWYQVRSAAMMVPRAYFIPSPPRTGERGG